MTTLRKRGATWLLVAALALLSWQLFTWGRGVSIAGLMAPGGRANLVVPPGFSATVYAQGLSGPRFLTFGPDGRLYVAESGKNRIVALHDSRGNGVGDEVREFAASVPSPHSVVWHDGKLYAGVPTGVIELEDRDGDGKADRRRVLIDDYATEGHSTRTVLFLNDGRMLVSVGSSCNVCKENDPRRASIVVYDGPGEGKKGERVFARGLRNAVGLAFEPVTGELWATCNGRDWLGDDLPPDTVDIVHEGDDFGWPRCNAGDLVDPDFGGPGSCSGVAQPAIKLQAHSAPLGLAFYTGTKFPPEYRGDLFVAFHGSWNRSVPTGYKVVRVHMQDGKVAGPVEDFATGFANEGATRVFGRPVGLAVGPDGALYVSDDRSGFIYRIAYTRAAKEQ
ncbi:MAG TPA: PQQ-dependent sugar dehydrogenase [Candidatus Binatia bacterium]